MGLRVTGNELMMGLSICSFLMRQLATQVYLLLMFSMLWQWFIYGKMVTIAMRKQSRINLEFTERDSEHQIIYEKKVKKLGLLSDNNKRNVKIRGN